MNKDCTIYENCIDTNPIEIKINNSFLEFLAVGCWGVYCNKGVKTIIKYKKGLFTNKRITYGQKYVYEALKKYIEKYPHIEDMYLAGDNVYEIGFENNDIKGQDDLKEKLILNSKAGYKIKKQLSEGFERCFNKIKISRFFVAIGNHDIENCDILNYQINYNSPTWNMPSLYYNVVYVLDNNTTINIIVIDTNMYENEALMCNGKLYSEKDILKQEKWATSFNNKYTWTIVIGHIPYVSLGHKNEQEIYNKRLGHLLERIRPHIYFCADEHNQQFLYNKNLKMALVVAGSGGATLDSIENTKLPKDVISYYKLTTHGFVSFKVSKSEIRIRYIQVNKNNKVKISFQVNIDNEGNIKEY